MNVRQFCYIVYLTTYMGGEGVKAVDRTLDQTKGDGEVNLAVAASAALGVHDHKGGVPPRSIEDLRAEVARLTGVG